MMEPATFGWRCYRTDAVIGSCEILIIKRRCSVFLIHLWSPMEGSRVYVVFENGDDMYWVL